MPLEIRLTKPARYVGIHPVGPCFVGGTPLSADCSISSSGQADFARYIVLHVSPTPRINIVAHDLKDDPEHLIEGTATIVPPSDILPSAIRFGVPLKKETLIRLESISKQIENAAKLIVHILGENGLCFAQKGLMCVA